MERLSEQLVAFTGSKKNPFVLVSDCMQTTLKQSAKFNRTRNYEKAKKKCKQSTKTCLSQQEERCIVCSCDPQIYVPVYGIDEERKLIQVFRKLINIKDRPLFVPRYPNKLLLCRTCHKTLKRLTSLQIQLEGIKNDIDEIVQRVRNAIRLSGDFFPDESEPLFPRIENTWSGDLGIGIIPVFPLTEQVAIIKEEPQFLSECEGLEEWGDDEDPLGNLQDFILDNINKETADKVPNGLADPVSPTTGKCKVTEKEEHSSTQDKGMENPDNQSDPDFVNDQEQKLENDSDHMGDSDADYSINEKSIRKKSTSPYRKNTNKKVYRFKNLRKKYKKPINTGKPTSYRSSVPDDPKTPEQIELFKIRQEAYERILAKDNLHLMTRLQTIERMKKLKLIVPSKDKDEDTVPTKSNIGNNRIKGSLFKAKINPDGSFLYKGFTYRKLEDGQVLCVSCGRFTKSDVAIRCHINKYHKDPSAGHKCEICGKSFYYYNAILKHKLTHTQERNFICETCGRSFTHRENLYCHRKVVHEGIKKFECDICNKKFATKKDMNNHKRTHSQLKPYQCENCGDIFTTSSSLGTHKRKHHSSKDKDTDHSPKRRKKSNKNRKRKNNTDTESQDSQSSSTIDRQDEKEDTDNFEMPQLQLIKENPDILQQSFTSEEIPIL